MKLIVSKRNDDYHVCLDSDSRIWECGKTISEAIGKWIMTHGKDFQIEIVN